MKNLRAAIFEILETYAVPLIVTAIVALLLFPLLSGACESLSSDFEGDDNRVTYVGAEIQGCEMCFKPNNGKKLFKKQNFGGKAFFGIRLTDCLTLEPGYQFMSASKKAVLYQGDSIFGGFLPPFADGAVFVSKLTIHGPYLDLIASTPRTEETKFQPFVGFGIYQAQGVFTRNLVLAGNMSFESYKKYEGHKILKRFLIGGNYYIRDDMSIRLSATYIDTKRLFSHQTSGTSHPRFYNVVMPKNSFCYGIGFGYHFK